MNAGTPATFLRVGQIVAGRYRIVRQIARGGMSEVYEVEDNLVREHVALKILRRKTAADPDAAERFRREILLARRITHPNVCRIFEAGVHESVPFLTMELLPGENLLQLVGRVGPMLPSDALPILEQVCTALTAAHQAGVVHRDLKSSNILLVPAAGGARGFRAVITDFGVARALQPDLDASILTNTGMLVGTPAYMAPEQVEGKAITERTDVYALGVVMYEMLTAELPFTGANPLATAELRLKKAPRPPTDIIPMLELRWERTILRCLMLRPEDRFQTPAEVLESLRSGHVTAEMDEDATTIDEDSSEHELHGPTVPMTADQMAVIEQAVAEVQAKRTSAGSKRSAPNLPAIGSATASMAPTVVALTPQPPPSARQTIPEKREAMGVAPVLPPRNPPPPLEPPPVPTGPTASQMPTDENPVQQPVQFVQATGRPEPIRQESQLISTGARTTPHNPRVDHLDGWKEKRRLVLIVAVVALAILVLWTAFDPMPSSLFGPPGS
jgi:serine/threonine protein kinase